MKDLSTISEVIVTPSSEEANLLLEDHWRLLDLYHDGEGVLLFVLGDPRPQDMKDFLKSQEVAS